MNTSLKQTNGERSNQHMKIDIILSVFAGMVRTAEQATLNSDSFWSSE